MAGVFTIHGPRSLSLSLFLSRFFPSRRRPNTTIYNRDMRHVRSCRRGPRAISRVRAERSGGTRGRISGVAPSYVGRARPTFLADPPPASDESQFNGSEDHNDEERDETMRRKFHGGFSSGDEMTHECPRVSFCAGLELSPESRFMRVSFAGAGKRVSLTSSFPPLGSAPLQRNFLFFRAEQETGDEMTL